MWGIITYICTLFNDARLKATENQRQRTQKKQFILKREI